MTTTFTILKEP